MSNADTIRKGYDAFAEGNIDGVLEVLDEGIKWHVPDSLPYGGDFDGHDGVRQFFDGFFDQWAEFTIETDDFVESGEHVVVTAIAKGKAKAGTDGGGPIAHVWKLEGDKAVHFQAYTDTARELEALAQNESEREAAGESGGDEGGGEEGDDEQS